MLDSDSDGSDEKAIAAMGILNTLDTIVTVMEDQKEVRMIKMSIFILNKKNSYAAL